MSSNKDPIRSSAIPGTRWVMDAGNADRRSFGRKAQTSPPRGPDELFARWHQQQDQRAREELVWRFLPLARMLASRYNGRGEPFDDLVQVASLALVKAIDRFDPARGNAFTSFAVPTILGELKRHFRDTGWSAHVPRATQELALRVQNAQERISAETGCSPTVHDLAEYLELTIEEVVDALEAANAHRAASLEIQVDSEDDGTRTLADTLGHEDAGFELVEGTQTIARAASELSEVERQVLALRFFENLTQTEIAKRVGVSQMQVSRLLRRALEQLATLTDPE